MFQSIDVPLRRIRDRLIARQHRGSGTPFINKILSATGRPGISDSDYKLWLEQLCADKDMSKAYEDAKPTLASDEASRRKHSGSWPDRVRSSMHMTELFYILPRAITPAHVLETGVAFGASSALILAAMHHNETGRLVSIDLPAHAAMAGHSSGAAVGVFVPQAFRSRWDFRTVNALEALQPAFSEATPDIFVHDSDHSYQHMMFEYSLAASYMPKGAVLISDDTRMNAAFYDFAGAVGAKVFPHGLNDSVACCVL